MAEAPRTIGLIANPLKPGIRAFLAEVRTCLEGRGIEVRLETSAAELAGNETGYTSAELGARCDLLVVLGGDGTLLWTLSQLDGAVKPIVAINAGTLGFLTCATAADYEKVVEALATGDYEISSRSMLEATIQISGEPEQTVTGLNELTLIRAHQSNTVQAETRVDGEFVNHYTGDGLIIATPTGSTAYSLSAGGPILEPGSGVFAMTPICPHALANRAIVIDNRRTIELLLPEQRGMLQVSVDGRPITRIDRETTITIRRAEAELPLILFRDTSFYAVLHRKLGWYGSSIINARESGSGE